MAASEQANLAKQSQGNEEALKREKLLQDMNKKIDDAYKGDLERLMQALEELRIEKDQVIRQMTAVMESTRAEYEVKIDQLELNLEKF